MHWILQNNIFNEKEWTTLVGTLERFQLPYSVHKVVPFIGELIPPAIPEAEKVICLGSYSMRHTAAAHGWNPGVYDIIHQTFILQHSHWGDLMLNSDSQVHRFEDAVFTEPTFVRPIDDSKYFAGQVFDHEEFEKWRFGVCVLEHDYGSSLTKDTLVQLCSPKEIYAEYRYWIVDSKVVTRSLYKRGDRVIYSADVDSSLDDFVARVIRPSPPAPAWQPHRAYVLDVCTTPDGIKIVEINTLNSAGFYAGNVTDIIMALEEMES
jgi:hypothetical protein